MNQLKLQTHFFIYQLSEDKGKIELISYCGLYCGDCFGRKGVIADLARDLRKELRKAKFERFAGFISSFSIGKVYKDYSKCYNVLGAMVKFRCSRSCREGGGPPFCKMRKCCRKKEIQGCWECREFETCSILDYLKPVHDDAHIRNLRNLKRKGTEAFISGKRYW